MVNSWVVSYVTNILLYVWQRIAIATREMSTSEVFKDYYSKLLVETLPMSTVFVAKLYSCGLLPRELKNKLNLLQGTPEDKATLFLDSVIEPSMI